MAVDGIKTIKESVLPNDQVSEALLCNCLKVQPITYSVLEGKVELMDGACLFLL